MADKTPWGESDELGALNRLDRTTVLSAMSAVRVGQVIPLATPIRHGHGFGVIGRTPPLHFMVRDGGDYAAGLAERAGFGFADDVITLPTHGVSHVDALSHVWRDGAMYNAHPASSVSSIGARRLGIEKMRPIVTRGVLVDVADGGVRDARARVSAAELQERLASDGVDLRVGDALLVRTGWLAAQRAGMVDGSAWPGLDASCGPWLAERQVVLVGADNVGVEAYPSGDPECQVPLHVELIVGHGIYLSELLDLDELAAALGDSGHRDFLFVLAPLPFVGAVGSPVAPVAVL